MKQYKSKIKDLAKKYERLNDLNKIQKVDMLKMKLSNTQEFNDLVLKIEIIDLFIKELKCLIGELKWKKSLTAY